MGDGSVSVAVVGGGNMGRHHVRNYASMPEASLCGVVDKDRALADDLAGRHGTIAFESVDALLAREPEVEAVSVVVPTAAHFEVVSTLLEAGKHVLVEKPIAASVAEAEHLTQLARACDRVLAVGHVERFNPAIRELKRRIDAGEMGRILSLVGRRVGIMPPQVRDADVILDLAVHDIDLFRYLLSADQPDEIFANAGRAVVEDRFDFADIFLRFNGAACLLQVNWITPVKIRSLAVTGTDGYADVEYVMQQLTLHRSRPVERVETFAELESYSDTPPAQIFVDRREPLSIELEEFLKAVRGQPADIVSGEEATRSIEIASAVAARASRR
jgi:UDP-N-acetylglucosamine 3-dehydrogenase